MRSRTGSPPRRPTRRPPRRDGRDAWLLALAALVPVALFSVYPLLQGLYLGFTDAHAGRNVVTSFTGADNYVTLLSNELFWSLFRIGLVWAFPVTVLQFASCRVSRSATPSRRCRGASTTWPTSTARSTRCR